MLQNLGASDFGLYNVVGGIVVLFNIINSAMTSASYRYVAFEIGRGDFPAVNNVFNISLTIHIVMALIVVLFAETVGQYYIYHYLNVLPGKIDDAMFVFRFSVLATVFSVFSIPFQGLITAYEKFSIRAFIEIITSVLRLLVAVALSYFLGDRVRWYSIFTAVVIAIITLIYVLYCYANYKEIIRWKFQADRKKYTEMLGFSGWIMLGTCAGMGKVQGAALMINSFFGTIINASFGIANQLNGLVLTCAYSLNQAAVPQIYKSYSSGNSDRMMQIVIYISKYTVFLMMLPSLPILLETEYLLKVWLGDVPEYTSIFCRLVILNALVNCLSESLFSAVQATGRIKIFQITINMISLFSLPIAFYLFRSGYPPYSVMLAFIATGFINVIASQMLLRRLIQFNTREFIQLFYLKVFYVILLILPLFFFRSFYMEGLMRFVVLSMSSVVWFLVAVYFLGTEKLERSKLSDQIRHYYNTIKGKACRNVQR